MNIKTYSSWPAFSIEEIDAVSDVLKSGKINYWTGNICRQFEDEFAKWCGTKYAIALSNGTVALELAFKALHLKPGDEVIVSSRTFIASVSAIVSAGGTPRFVDIDLASGNIDPKMITKSITSKTRAILCVHLGGWPCEISSILEIADEYGIRVVEDCAQAHGALYKGSRVGSLGHIAAWSFCQDKIMSTGGEGGMVTTNDEVYWREMWAYKDHGKSYEAIYKKQHPPGYRWVHESLGSNFRMLELQAAIGLYQLKKVDEWVTLRNRNAEAIYDVLGLYSGSDGFIDIPRLDIGFESRHAFYKAYAYLRIKKLGNKWSRDSVVSFLNEAGIPCNSGSCSEVYLEKAFDGTGLRPNERLPNAKYLGESSISFLVHPTLTSIELEDILYKIKLKFSQLHSTLK
jgi:dTDP-4-amino-4,6-dideoxygalactose transaminase